MSASYIINLNGTLLGNMKAENIQIKQSGLEPINDK